MYSSNYIHLCLIIWWWQLLYLSVFLLFFSNILLITYTFILFTNRITCDPCLDCIIRTLTSLTYVSQLFLSPSPISLFFPNVYVCVQMFDSTSFSLKLWVKGPKRWTKYLSFIVCEIYMGKANYACFYACFGDINWIELLVRLVNNLRIHIVF